MDNKELAWLILKAQSIREKSWDENKEMDWEGGRYRLDQFQAACEAMKLPSPTSSEGAGLEYIVFLLNACAGNNAQLWAMEQLGYPADIDDEAPWANWRQIELLLSADTFTQSEIGRTENQD